VAGVGSSVEFRVGSSVGGSTASTTVAPGPGPAGLRSLPAKQHAPKARPSPATDRGRRGEVPGRPSSTNDCAVRACAAAECRTFALDGRASRRDGTTSLPASLVASKPGGDIPRLQPSSDRSDVSAGGRYAQAYAIWAIVARRAGGADYGVVPEGRTTIRRASCWPRARMQVAWTAIGDRTGSGRSLLDRGEGALLGSDTCHGLCVNGPSAHRERSLRWHAASERRGGLA
jgi:hypothetical protein